MDKSGGEMSRSRSMRFLGGVEKSREWRVLGVGRSVE
jgi:hypothetical protein